MFSVILLMAGTGSRMKSNVNKVLLPYKNKKIYEVSLDLFKKYSNDIICVVNENDKLDIQGVTIVTGGETRQESVYNALKVVKTDYVMIHDCARPLLSETVLKEIISKIALNKAILTYSKEKNTIKQLVDNKLVTLPRETLISASTPQCASKKIMLDCHNKAIIDNYQGTDDISLIEKYHKEVQIDLVEQNEENFKITTPLDYELLQIIGEKYD